jgi:hypothetical protein
MTSQGKPPPADHEGSQEPYEPPRAEDLDAAEGAIATASGAGSGTPPSDESDVIIGPGVE